MIDAAKFLASVVTAENRDPWDDFAAGRYPQEILPSRLCPDAAGNRLREQRRIGDLVDRARSEDTFRERSRTATFAIMDPATMASLDKRQLGNGVVDAFTTWLSNISPFRKYTCPVRPTAKYCFAH